MIRLFLFIFRLTVLAVVILLCGQIEVKGKRISDHVKDLTMKSWVQKPIHFIAQRVEFTTSGKKALSAKNTANTAVSGLLKRKPQDELGDESVNNSVEPSDSGPDSESNSEPNAENEETL